MKERRLEITYYFTVIGGRERKKNDMERVVGRYKSGRVIDRNG